MNQRLRLLCSVGLLGFVAWRLNWQQIGHAFGHMRPAYWLAALSLYLATQLASALRWQILARPLGFRRALRQYLGFYFIGMFFNLVLPTAVGGDVVRAWYLNGGSGRKARAFLSVLIDRLSGLFILVILAALATLVSPLALPAWVRLSVWGTVAAAIAGFALLPQLARYPRIQAQLGPMADDTASSLVMAFRPSALGLSLFVQASNCVLVWLVGEALGAAVPFAYYWVVVPMVSLLTMAPVSINGLGVREAGMVLFLQPFGVPAATAVSLAFLWFCVFAAASLAGGLVYLFGRFPRPEVQTHEAVGHHSDQGRAGQSKAAA